MIEWIAHRGASKEAPENTLAAFKKAIEIGVDWIEMDVHVSRDGIPFIIHDAIIGRTCSGPQGKRITDFPMAEIEEFDAGSWFDPQFSNEKIVTLDAVLAMDRGKTGLMIELKKGHSPFKVISSAVVKAVKGHSNLVVGSFSHHIIEEIQALAPEIPLIGIIEDFNRVEIFREMKLPRWAIWYKLLNPALINGLHEEGSSVWAFTVDERRVAEFLVSIGVDGIITNDPRNLKF